MLKLSIRHDQDATSTPGTLLWRKYGSSKADDEGHARDDQVSLL